MGYVTLIQTILRGLAAALFLTAYLFTAVKTGRFMHIDDRLFGFTVPRRMRRSDGIR
jgi:hypothetical protein